MNVRVTTEQEFFAEAVRRFGSDPMKFAFVCPSCGHVATVQDYKDAGAPEGAVGFSCVGRWLPERSETFGKPGTGPCNYAGGGLFCISPVEIEGRKGRYFDLAPAPET